MARSNLHTLQRDVSPSFKLCAYLVATDYAYAAAVPVARTPDDVVASLTVVAASSPVVEPSVAELQPEAAVVIRTESARDHSVAAMTPASCCLDAVNQ